MKLNQYQRYALLAFLFKHFTKLDEISVIYDFDNFCDGKIREWRIIYEFGMAGKIWNNSGRIYVSGHSGSELGGFKSKAYLNQQKRATALNEELELLISKWATD